MTEQNQNFEMFQGETKTLDVTETDSEDLTGMNITWVMAKEAGSNPVVKKETGDGIEIVGGSQFEISLDPEDTNEIAGKHYHEARVVDDGSTELVVFTGEVNIHESATN